MPTDTVYGSTWAGGTLLPDGNLIVLGVTDDGLWDATVRKVDVNGNTIWGQRVATVNNQIGLRPTKVVANSNGEIMVFGRRMTAISPFWGTYRNQFAFVLDASGNLQWARIYQLSDMFGNYANVPQADDIQPVVGGWMMTISKTDGIHAIRLDSNGAITQRTT